MKHLDVFSGIGGFALAARWAGIETVAFCECESSCRKVLSKNFNNTPIHKDVRGLNGNDFAGIDLITGGYPCQPFSVAGSQKAKEDARHLWPELFRVITQAKPTWVLCENVYGHIKLGLDGVLYDLEGIGYTCQPFVIPAQATGANHRRDRVFIVAYAASNGRDESTTTSGNGETDEHREKRANENSDNERRGSLRPEMARYSNPFGRRGVKPPALRVADELPDRMDRNRMLGNAIDPEIAYQILKCIKEVSNG